METDASHRTPVFRFGVFELDIRAGELRKSGRLIHLQPQPFRVLTLLASRAGDVVTREELQQQIWGGDTFVDFEQGLNYCVKQIRLALGDDAESPRYIETLPRRGYRFVAPVEEKDHAGPLPARTRVPTSMAESGARSKRVWAAALVASLALAAWVGWKTFRPPAAAPAVQKVMLLVLPFENIGNDPQEEYLSDGLTEEMINRLAGLQPQRLGVIARTSSMHYKNTDKTIEQIGRELEVDYILEGAVRHEGSRVRITAQLVQVRDQTPLWANTMERDLHSILALQSEVARTIASHIALELTPGTRAMLAQAGDVDPELYEAYLRGRFHLQKYNSVDTPKALAYFEKVLARNPNHALAWVGVAQCYTVGNQLGLRPHESAPKARAAIEKALALEDTLAEAHVSMAVILDLYDWNWAGSEKELRRALELNPGLPEAHTAHAWHWITLGHPAAGVAAAERAWELDPLNVAVNVVLGRMYYYARRYDDAVAQFQKTIELDPSSLWAHFFLGITYSMKGSHDEAARALIRAARIPPGEDSQELAAAMESAYAASGFSGLLRVMTQRWETRVELGFAQSTSVAMFYATLGEKEKAFQWLERAYRERSRVLAYIKPEPQLDGLRNDPRYADLLRRMGLPPD